MTDEQFELLKKELLTAADIWFTADLHRKLLELIALAQEGRKEKVTGQQGVA